MSTRADSRTLVGKVIVVTGSTSGLGKATALEAALQGANVVVSGRREAEGLAVVKEITDNGGSAIFAQCDVTDENDVSKLITTTVERFGRIDGAFLNAGTSGTLSSLIEAAVADWDKIHKTNATSMFITLKHVTKQMSKQSPQGGSVVLCSSVASLIGAGGLAAYASTKASNETLGRAAAVEGAPLNIRVNILHPGPIDTEINNYMGPDDVVGQFGKATLFGRVGRSIEIAKPVCFLLSDGSTYMTGSSIVVDGGYVAK